MRRLLPTVFLPVLLGLILLGLVLQDSASASNGKKFRVLDLGPIGRITQRVCHDFDGDGIAEILVFTAHTVRVYLPKSDGGYNPANWETIEAPADALLFGVGQVDSVEKTDELVFVTPAGLIYYRVKDGVLGDGPHLLFSARSLVSAGQEDDVHWRGFLRDLDGDGMVDIVLPTAKGFALFYQRRFDEDADPSIVKGAPGKWPEKPDRLLPYRLRASLQVGSPGLTGRIEGTIGTPDYHVADFTGDGRRDVAVDDGLSLRIFPAGEDGRVAGVAEKSIDLQPLADQNGDLPRFHIRDVNGDGQLDYILSHRKQGVVDIFLGGESLWKPAMSIEVSGWCYDPVLADLDGDGTDDLIIPTTPEVDFTTAISVMMSGAIEVRNHIFLNSGKRDVPFAKEATKTRMMSVRIRLFLTATGQIAVDRSLLVNYSGDFNDDGRKDLIIREGTRELRLYFGVPEGIFAAQEAYSVLIPDTGDYTSLDSDVTDLNGDGRPDVAIYYRSRDRKGDRIVLVLSTGKGWK